MKEIGFLEGIYGQTDLQVGLIECIIIFINNSGHYGTYYKIIETARMLARAVPNGPSV